MKTRGERPGVVGVLMGGCSPERDISFKSGKAVCKALEREGCKVIPITIDSRGEKEIISRLKEFKLDVAFIALHGEFGEDGQIQAIIEKSGIPYTGSDVDSSRLAMNKVSTKRKLSQKGIAIPEYSVISKGEEIKAEDILRNVKGLPLVVKSSCSGSSIGTTIVRQEGDLTGAIALAFQYGTEIIVERYINGKEIAAGILGEDPLPLVEIRPKDSFFDFKAKYQKGMTDYIVPADVSDKITAEIQKIAYTAHQDLGCRDFSRVDFILDTQGNPFLLEVNTIPGFTATSLVPMAAEKYGYSFSEICLMIAQFAVQRKNPVRAA